MGGIGVTFALDFLRMARVCSKYGLAAALVSHQLQQVSQAAERCGRIGWLTPKTSLRIAKACSQYGRAAHSLHEPGAKYASA